MKKAALFALLSIITLACKKSSVDKKDDVIKYKETVTINDVPQATLTFFDVLDSRCPEGVNCFWAGNATVDLTLEGVTTEGKITKHVNMCVDDCRTLYPVGPYRTSDSLDQDFAGEKYRFILEGVNRPSKADSTATKADYSISLRIEKQ